jgi:protein-S-isoprenylcysteine O-methyltransferase Ste14
LLIIARVLLEELEAMEDALILAAVIAYVGVAAAWPTLRFFRLHGVWPVVFAREAAPAQRVLGWLTRALLVAIVGASAARVALGPGPLGIWSPSPGVKLFGWLLFGTGAALTVVAQRQMGASWRVGIDDRPTGLVREGVFRLVRNPIFTGLLILLAGYACLTPAWWSIGLWLATALALRIQIAHEERHLMRLHGRAYLDYAARVGRLVPRLGRLREPRPAAESEGRP